MGMLLQKTAPSGHCCFVCGVVCCLKPALLASQAGGREAGMVCLHMQGHFPGLSNRTAQRWWSVLNSSVEYYYSASSDPLPHKIAQKQSDIEKRVRDGVRSGSMAKRARLAYLRTVYSRAATLSQRRQTRKSHLWPSTGAPTHHLPSRSHQKSTR
jgi:hypothetical protein